MNSNLAQGRAEKIIDAFPFFNEIDLLKVRLEYLGPCVDFFIISEANVNFAGREKGFLLSPEIIKTLPFNEKIIYHQEKINFLTPKWLWKRFKYLTRPSKFLWQIQNAQRNGILKPLEQFNQYDIVILGDIDEIPNELVIQKIKEETEKSIFPEKWAISCEQELFYYHLNNQLINEKWYGSIFTQIIHFKSHKPHKIRGMRDHLNHLELGGWHFSYFMSADLIKNKILAIADVENISKFKSLDKSEITDKMIAGHDLFDRPISFTKKIDLNEIPSKLAEVLKKYLPDCVPKKP